MGEKIFLRNLLFFGKKNGLKSMPYFRNLHIDEAKIGWPIQNFCFSMSSALEGGAWCNSKAFQCDMEVTGLTRGNLSFCRGKVFI